MTRTALILGCSHAAGSEMHMEPEVDLGGYIPQTFGLYNSYASAIAQALGYHPMNYAIPGGSNDAIFRTWETFVNPYSNLVRPDLVIACWTGGNRTEIWDFENSTWQQLAPGKQKFYKTIENDDIPTGEFIPEPVDNNLELLAYQKQWTVWHNDRWSGRLNKLKNILALNAMAEIEKIPVINLDSFDAIKEFVYPANVYRPMGNDEFTLWAAKAGFNNTGMGHFFSDAHKLFAKRVVAKLDQRYYAKTYD